MKDHKPPSFPPSVLISPEAVKAALSAVSRIGRTTGIAVSEHVLNRVRYDGFLVDIFLVGQGTPDATERARQIYRRTMDDLRILD